MVSNIDFSLTLCKPNLCSCRRPDISSGLKKLKCRTLIFIGDQSPFYSEAVHMAATLDRGYCALVEV